MHIEKFDLTQLRLLAELAETGSVSAAAQRIGLSQSAASHALARLRRSLGEEIFVRTTAGMRPTPFGDSLARAAREALGTLRASLESRAGFEPLSSRRTFQIYLSDVGQMVFLPRLLAYIQENAPGVSLRVLTVPAEGAHVALESGQVDLAAGYFTTLKAGFRQQRLFREHYLCAVRADHPRFERGMSVKAFGSVQHALADSSGMAHGFLERVLARHRLVRPIRLAVPQFMVLPLVIANSDLLVTMPSRLAREFSKLVRLRLMKPPVPIGAYDIRTFWHERYHNDPANRWLRKVFAELFQDRDADGGHAPSPDACGITSSLHKTTRPRRHK
ncbi:MAG: LysR family transcriptional regulator [Proteobacteria bacterium]|nr:LysR family transcriptional regulator [Pseudomonadota bacterium]